MVSKLGESAESAGKTNVAFLSFLLLGQLEKCLQILIDTDRIPEAAFFARYNLIQKLLGLLSNASVLSQIAKCSDKPEVT